MGKKLKIKEAQALCRELLYLTHKNEISKEINIPTSSYPAISFGRVELIYLLSKIYNIDPDMINLRKD